jgi:hypothetical protein
MGTCVPGLIGPRRQRWVVHNVAWCVPFGVLGLVRCGKATMDGGGGIEGSCRAGDGVGGWLGVMLGS